MPTHSQLVNNHTVQVAVEVPHHRKCTEGGSLGHCFPALYHLAMWQHGPREQLGHQQRDILANRKQSVLWGHTCGVSDGANTASKMPSPGKCLSDSSAPQRSLKWQAAVTASSLQEMPVALGPQRCKHGSCGDPTQATACRTLVPCHQFKIGHGQEGRCHFRSQNPV